MEMTLKPTPIPDLETKERLFQCSTCKRSFTRVDHLMRHVRSHTKQRPYVCPTCSKGFARVDLLKRHVANHATDHTKKRQRAETVRQSRVVQACEECSKNHLRCEDDKPCSRCKKKNIACRLPATVQNDMDAAQELDAAQDLLDLSNNFGHPSDMSVSHANMISPQRSQSSVQEAVMVAPQHMSPMMDSMDVSLNMLGAPAVEPSDAQPSFLDDPIIPFTEDSPIDPLLPDYLRNMQPLETSLSGYATPRGTTNCSFNWDLDFSGFDFGSFSQFNHQETIPEEILSTDTQNTEQQCNSRKAPQDDAAERAEAFKKSVWRFMPGNKLNPVTAEESNLAFPDGESEGQSPSCIPARRVLKERLPHCARDKLLGLVLNTSSSTNSRRISAGFPSLELLDGMIQLFLTAPSIDAGSWIHLSTFSPAKLHPELLACIVAAGAFSAPDKSLQTLGLALQESSRVGIGKSFDEDNTLIRDLQHLQVQLLQVEVGMWSGISRKMEIAESFLQPPITMLRRGGRFRRGTWKKIVPLADDNGGVLQEKWKEWVLQESWLRLVYRFFEFDRQSSMALLKPPLISYGEMQIPIPHPDSLWYAPSASAWKAAYLSSPAATTKRPRLYDCIEDLEHLNYHPMANTGYLYMVWGMIWEYRQMAALTAKSQYTSTLLLSSRHQELSNYCEDFHVSSPLSSKHVDIILGAMFMHLNAPLDDVQTFAGVAGPDEARHAFPTLRDWVATASARQALWHSAQILRLAETLPKGTLRDFYAMTVYQAALVLWEYGLLKQPSEQTPSPNVQSLVVLNGEENMEVKRFVKLGRGEPGVRIPGSQAIVPLSNASEVIGIARHLLRQNHDAIEGTCPPLVDSLVLLIEGLQSATK